MLNDLRHAFRMLLKNPGFTAVAVLTLAIGIGANTAIFSVVNAVLVQPLPFKDPQRLMTVWERNPQQGYEQYPVAPGAFLDWQEQNHVFESLAIYDSPRSFVLTGQSQAEQVMGSSVSSNLFRTLGVTPLMGRDFAEQEQTSGHNQVVLLGYSFWQRRFNAESTIIGKAITLDGLAYTVIGVMPPKILFPGKTGTVFLRIVNQPADVWMPMILNGSVRQLYSNHSWQVIGRLKTDITPARALTEMDAIQQHIEADHPDQSLGTHVRVVALREQGVADVRLALLILLGAVALVLLIACVNVANLLLVRTAARGKEIGVRLALGADRFRLARQLLTEGLVLAGAGAGLGLLMAYSAIQLLIRQIGSNIFISTPGWEQIGIDRGVLLFTVALALLSTLIFGCAPAWRATKTDLRSSLKQGDRGGAGMRQRLQSTLAVAQVAMSLTLLIAAALLIQSFARLEQVEPGFHPAGLLTVQLDLPRRSYPTDQARAAFFDRLLPQLRALPGAQSVDMATGTPFESGGNANFNWSITVDGRQRDTTGKLISADWRAVTPEYFRTMGIALVKGRFFTEHDAKDSQSVALVNEAFVRANVPAGQEPLDTHVGDFGGHSTGAGAIIVGVVRDFKQVGLDADVRRDVYTPQAQTPWTNSRVVVVRTDGDPSMLANPVRNELKTLDPDLPITSLQTMDTLISGSVAQPRFRTLLLSLFAALALILTAIGIYGVIAYSVAQRTTEIGIRMALGAQRSGVLALVLRQGMKLAGIGIVIGLTGALALTRVLGNLLFEIKPNDPLTFVGVSLFLLVVAFLACYLPARRAASVDPIVALRGE